MIKKEDTLSEGARGRDATAHNCPQPDGANLALDFRFHWATSISRARVTMKSIERERIVEVTPSPGSKDGDSPRVVNRDLGICCQGEDTAFWMLFWQAPGRLACSV
ncbi:hypothetical protein MC885_018409, partial [Smutsia gigantea]